MKTNNKNHHCFLKLFLLPTTDQNHGNKYYLPEFCQAADVENMKYLSLIFNRVILNILAVILFLINRSSEGMLGVAMGKEI